MMTSSLLRLEQKITFLYILHPSFGIALLCTLAVYRGIDPSMYPLGKLARANPSSRSEVLRGSHPFWTDANKTEPSTSLNWMWTPGGNDYVHG